MTNATALRLQQIESVIQRLFPLALALLVLVLMLGRSVDGDVWWHLANGRWMADNGRLLSADPFSYTRPGTAWAHPGYPVDLALYGAYRLAGYTGVDVLGSLPIIAGLLLTYFALPGRPLRRFLLTLAGAVVSLVYWSARPNGYLFLFVTLTIILLERYRARRLRRLWALPAIFLAWANIHGGFTVGLMIFGFYILDEWREPRRMAHMVVVFVCSLLATLINPYGLGIYQEMAGAFGRTTEQALIQEWQSPDFHQPYVQIFLLALVGTLILTEYARQIASGPVKPLSPSRFLIPAALIGMALISLRSIATFGVALPFIWNNLLPFDDQGKRQVESIRPVKPDPVSSGIALTFCIFLIIALIGRLQTLPSAPVDLRGLPSGAVSYLRSVSAPRNLFNGYNWGGYLIWSLPEMPDFVDPRSNVFGDDIINQSRLVEQAQPGWEQVIEQWGIHTVLVAADAPVGGELLKHGWQRCYQDELAAVFIDAPACP